MIPLRITTEVQNRIAPGLSPDEADAVVLADLADGWTLTHTSGSLRSEPGAQGALNLDGRSHQYLARLADYELPFGWCICPPASTTCSCREPRAEPYTYKGAPAVVLTKCEPHNNSNAKAVFAGDRYH
ncbi:MAG TPA: hypothetical protein VK680_04120, partial [Solirubrobacteraceae bacterium]|nr:hypothetical protein [Solirubrobacteraceae bacterium]